jgi:hypothetical protein
MYIPPSIKQSPQLSKIVLLQGNPGWGHFHNTPPNPTLTYDQTNIAHTSEPARKSEQRHGRAPKPDQH